MTFVPLAFTPRNSLAMLINRSGNPPFGQKHLEDPVPEDRLQLFQVQGRCDQEHAAAVSPNSLAVKRLLTNNPAENSFANKGP
jgi:hypothetical protein